MTPAPVNIVICDDKQQNRLRYGDALKVLPGAHPLAIQHPELLAQISAAPSLVVMDLQFPTTPDSEDFELLGHKYLPQLRQTWPHTKVLLVTEVSEGTKEIIIECFRKRLIDDVFDGARAYSQSEFTARAERLLFPHGPRSTDGVWLAHISDLHFGGSFVHGYHGPAEDGFLSSLLIDDLTNSVPAVAPNFPGLDLLVCTGDVTDKGRPIQFEKVTAFFRALRAPDGVFSPEGLDRGIIAIPGNHDVNWDISRARCIHEGTDGLHYTFREPDDTSVDLAYLSEFVFAPFEAFVGQPELEVPTKRSRWSREGLFRGCRWDLPEMGLQIFGFNSCGEAPYHERDFPGIAPSIIRELSERIQPGDTNLRMALVHHPMGSTKGRTTQPNNEHLADVREEMWRRLRTSVFLCGHVHKDTTEVLTVDGPALLFIDAGSISKGGVNDPLHYNLLHVTPSLPHLDQRAEIEVFSRVLQGAQFVPKPKRERLRYYWQEPGGWSLS